MKRSLVGISIFLVCLELPGQNFRLNMNCGYGLYQLNDLKDFQFDLKEYYSQLPIEMTEQFPGYSNYSVSGEIYLNPDNIIGINGTFYTTGARNHVKDYSGEYKLDMPLNGYRIGLQYQNILYKFNKINLYAQFKGGITLSTFKLKESFIIYNVYSTSSNATFKSIPFFVEPSLGFFYHIINRTRANNINVISLAIEEEGMECYLNRLVYLNDKILKIRDSFI